MSQYLKKNMKTARQQMMRIQALIKKLLAKLIKMLADSVRKQAYFNRVKRMSHKTLRKKINQFKFKQIKTN